MIKNRHKDTSRESARPWICGVRQPSGAGLSPATSATAAARSAGRGSGKASRTEAAAEEAARQEVTMIRRLTATH